MKRTSLLAFVAVIAAAFAGACGNDMPFDPMDPRLEGATLQIVGSPAVTLMYGGTANLRVRYADASGVGIENAPLDYEIVGEPGGSRLAALQTISDVEGEGVITLTAGGTNANFSIEVSAPTGDPVRFDVAVSDSELGSIVVSMTYAGDRALERFDTFLYRGEACGTLNPRMLPTAIRMSPSVTSVTSMPAFAGVPVASDYTIAVVARTGSAVSAFGCRDNIVVTNGNETPVAITLQDQMIPPSFVGIWDLDNRFDFGEALPGSVNSVLEILEELADDNDLEGEHIMPPGIPDPDTDGDGRAEYGQDPGAFIVDIAARQTCHWECDPGDTRDTCEPDHRLGDLEAMYLQDFTSWGGGISRVEFGGCGVWELFNQDAQGLVNDQIDDFLPDFVGDWLELVSDLASAITNARILSVMTVNMSGAGNEFDLPMQHELVQMVVNFRNPESDPPGAVEERIFSLADAGFSTLPVEEITTVDGTTLNIPEHSFTMNWGDLVLYIYRNVLLNEIWGVTSTGDLLGMWVNCNSIATSLHGAI
ncbi:MAG: hypothetical protein AB8I08_01995, partial [Sandaracinaceae bacterium]